jgi:hypothetical protein
MNCVRFKLLLGSLVVILFSAVNTVYADNTGDNPLEPLLEGLSEKWSLEVSGVYPEASEGATFNRVSLRDSNLPHNFEIDVPNPKKAIRSYLYLLVSDYYQPSMVWTVEFNGNVLVLGEHSKPSGGNIRGDGRLDHERQTFLFDVTGMTNQGPNILTITDYYSTQSYFFDGAILLNFYPSDEEHQYWIYHGVEYLEKVDYVDVSYEQVFKGRIEDTGSEGTLYTVYQNAEREHDELYFNGNLLRDKHATYLFKASEMNAKKFSVSKQLESSNTATFTMERYQPEPGAAYIQYAENPIYPSIVILDLKLPPKPKVVVLANSIDKNISSELFGFLKSKGLDVVHVTADDFEFYKDEKFIIILGGPDAPEGIGDIVKGTGMLKIDDADYIRTAGNRNKYFETNPWGGNPGQIVWILAGSDRQLTLQANLDHRGSVSEEIEENIEEPEIEIDSELEPCPELAENPMFHVYPEVMEDVFICQVVYSGGPSDWMVKLYNQGNDDVNLLGYKLIDYRDKFYKITASIGDVVIPEGGYWTIYGTKFNPEGQRSTGVYFPAEKGSVFLMDASENMIDKAGWNLGG